MSTLHLVPDHAVTLGIYFFKYFVPKILENICTSQGLAKANPARTSRRKQSFLPGSYLVCVLQWVDHAVTYSVIEILFLLCVPFSDFLYLFIFKINALKKSFQLGCFINQLYI